MKIYICDDEQTLREQLKTEINEFFTDNNYELPEIYFFSLGEELLSISTEPDILFLDIEMKGHDGIYVGNELHRRYKNIITIIVTSYAEYLDDAMRFNVFRYLSKPVDKQRLYRNLTDALNRLASRDAVVEVKCREADYTIPMQDIVMVETEGRNVTVHTMEKSYVTLDSMKYWEQTLTANCFYQCHRCYIINMKYVYRHDGETIQLCKGRFTAYNAKRKYHEFKAKYLMYLESMR
ncbi:MAG: LytR/AlgR family response regulator transcription factor [Lachnospiraceae bacterium]